MVNDWIWGFKKREDIFNYGSFILKSLVFKTYKNTEVSETLIF